MILTPSQGRTPNIEVYDTVIVGSSPVCLIDAIFLGRIGREVLVVDRRDRLGGAWSTVDIPGYPNLERAPRVFLKNPLAYRFMESELGFSLIATEPQALWRSQRVPFRSYKDELLRELAFYRAVFFPSLLRLCASVKNSLVSIRYGGDISPDVDQSSNSESLSDQIKCLFNNSFPRIHKAFKRCFKAFKDDTFRQPKKHLFPRGGSREMIQILSSKLTEAGVNIKLNTEVQAIDSNIKPGSIAVKLAGEWVYCQELVITRKTGVGEVITDVGTFDISEGQSNHPHLYLIVEDPLSQISTFVNMVDHPLVIRLGAFPIESQTDGVEDHSVKLITVHLNWLELNYHPGCQLNPEQVAEIMMVLKESKLLGEDANLISYYLVDYPTSNMDINVLHILQERLGRQLRILDYNSLSDGIADNADRWRSMLESRDTHETLSAQIS